MVIGSFSEVFGFPSVCCAEYCVAEDAFQKVQGISTIAGGVTFHYPSRSVGGFERVSFLDVQLTEFTVGSVTLEEST